MKNYIIKNTSNITIKNNKYDDVKVKIMPNIEVYLTINLDINSSYKIDIMNDSILYLNVISKNNKSIDLITNVFNNSIFNIKNIFLNSESNNKYYINLNEENSSTNFLLSTYLKNKNQKHDIVVNHLASNTNSNIVNNGVLNDSSNSTIKVVSHIKNGCNGSKASQKSKLIMLDDNSMADISPILSIDEHDVLATHSATVSKIEENLLYYMMSRGISKKDACNLFATGFLTQFINDESIIADYLKEVNNE